MKKTRKILCALLCTAILTATSASAFYTTNPDSSLEIPENATSVELTSSTFEDYFEIIEILGENETDERMMGIVKGGYSDNTSFKSQIGLNNVDFYHLDNAYAELNEANDLWLISPTNVIQYTSLRDGPFRQVSGIYDRKNNILYYSTLNSNTGYAFSNFRENGLVSAVKFDVTTFGNPTVYKLTTMLARFKKLPYITVSYNNELISFDQKPVIESGRTLVPLRAIFEKIGASVEWNEETQTVTAAKDDTTISLTINNTEAVKNGQSITLDVPAKVVNGRTLVPVRFVADCFGVSVEWNEDIERVVLTN